MKLFDFKKIWQKFEHRLAHWFHYFEGTVDTFYREDGLLMVCYICNTCGKKYGVAPCEPRFNKYTDVKRDEDYV